MRRRGLWEESLSFDEVIWEVRVVRVEFWGMFDVFIFFVII